RWGHTCVVYGGKMWLIGGHDYNNRSKNDIWCSDNGTTWTLVTSAAAFSPRAGHSSVVIDGKMWVIGGNSSSNDPGCDAWCSSDVISLNRFPFSPLFSPRASHSSIIFNNKIWCLGGINGAINNQLWSSLDETPDAPPAIDSVADAIVNEGDQYLGP